MSGVVRAALWGPEHLHHGQTATATIGADVAIGIDRGRHPKAYPHTDPNEDVVAAVVDGDRALLVVADGHRGQDAAVVAVEAVLRWAADGLPAELDRHAAVDLVHEVNRQVMVAVRDVGCANPESRTTLALALVVGPRCWWASMGDSAVFAGTAGAVRRLGKDRSRFIGWPMHHRDVRFALQHGRHDLAADDAVVVCSDGLHEFARGRAAHEAVRAALARPDPTDVVVAVIDAAGEAGAGDNVAVAVWRPTR